jgi:hypothetical protein
MVIRLALTVLLLGMAHFALAAPPENADPALAPFFQSLKQPDNGIGCCSVADCRHPESRQVADGYEVFIDEKTFGLGAPNVWLPVPAKKILQRADNPTGRPVTCWSPGIGIMCFVRGIET